MKTIWLAHGRYVERMKSYTVDDREKANCITRGCSTFVRHIEKQVREVLPGKDYFKFRMSMPEFKTRNKEKFKAYNIEKPFSEVLSWQDSVCHSLRQG